MAENLLDVLLSAETSQDFQIDLGGSSGLIPFSQILHLLNCYAANLKARSVGVGDIVVFQGAQSAEAFILFWATQWLGAIFCPIDQDWPDYALQRACNALKPSLVVASGSRRKIMRTLFAEAEFIEATYGSPCESSLAVDSKLGGEEEAFRPATPPEESAAVYLFTSGTTASPKVVVLSRRALLNSAHTTITTFEWRTRDRLLNLPEPHTMSGLRNAFIAAPLAGMTWCCAPALPQRSFADVITMVVATRCNQLVAGPALVGQLARWGERLDPEALKEVRNIYTTGASLSSRDAQDFYDRHGIPVINYYGLTETGGVCISQSVTGWQPGDRSLGRPVGCAARLVAEDGSVGDYGELQIDSPQLMSRYLNDPAQSAERFAEPWLRTGDIVKRDECGRLILLGRANCYIKTTTTERVHPEEVESVLEEHGTVAEAGVLGVISASNVERIAALVVLRNAQLASSKLSKELSDFVGSRLGQARAPMQIQFVPKLPRFANGKLERRLLPGMLT